LSQPDHFRHLSLFLKHINDIITTALVPSYCELQDRATIKFSLKLPSYLSGITPLKILSGSSAIYLRAAKINYPFLSMYRYYAFSFFM